jgi:hypothetical protein
MINLKEARVLDIEFKFMIDKLVLFSCSTDYEGITKKIQELIDFMYPGQDLIAVSLGRLAGHSGIITGSPDFPPTECLAAVFTVIPKEDSAILTGGKDDKSKPKHK